MRTLLVGFSLALIALAVSPAQAHYRHHDYYHGYSHRNYGDTQVRYESCNCYFGYVGNGAGVCSPVTSCYSEGGRCKASCAPQIGSLYFRSP
jgi:hypothetical protein